MFVALRIVPFLAHEVLAIIQGVRIAHPVAAKRVAGGGRPDRQHEDLLPARDYRWAAPGRGVTRGAEALEAGDREAQPGDDPLRPLRRELTGRPEQAIPQATPAHERRHN